MKHIKKYEEYLLENNDTDFDNESAPEFLNSIDQKFITVHGDIYNRYLENDDFIYFTKEEDTVMYKKSDLSLASDNYFAYDSLYGDLVDKNYTWASEEALYTMKEIEKEI